MKTLIIFVVLLGIVFFYFVANTEKSVILKSDEVTPTGVNIKKIIDGGNLSETMTSAISGFKTANDNGSETGAGTNNSTFIGQAIDKTRDLTGKVIDKAENLIKNPIENKINELFCPQK